MSCSICLNDPPNDPVSTIDGSIYCLECISTWFDSGKDTSPTTGLKVLKLLIPATTLCQNLNIPITKIPERFSQNSLSVQNPPRLQPQISNIDRLLTFLRESFQPLRYCDLFGIMVNDILKLYQISRNYFNCSNETIFYDKIKFYQHQYFSFIENPTIENGGLYILNLSNPTNCLLLKAFISKNDFSVIKPDLNYTMYIRPGYYNLFLYLFLKNISFELLTCRENINNGFNKIFGKAKNIKYSKFYVNQLNQFEIRRILEINNIMPIHATNKKELSELLVNSNIVPNIVDFYQIYAV